MRIYLATILIFSSTLLGCTASGKPPVDGQSQRAARFEAAFKTLHQKDPSAADFRLHRAKYQEIVRTAKTLPLINGATQERPLAGLPVLIEKDAHGLYTITMTTNALGHGGDYGYTYTDASLKTKPDAAYPQMKTLGTASYLRFVDRKLNPHWWIVYNNLD